jgi:Subtilase family/Secretion system C-terminal sorting domain
MTKLTLFYAFLCFFTPLFSQDLQVRNKTADHKLGEILFQTVDNESVKSLVNTLNHSNSLTPSTPLFMLKTVSEDLNYYKISFDPTLFNEKDILIQLNAQPSVRAVQFNYFVELRSTPNDPLFNKQWSLNKINAPSVWDVTSGGKTACGDSIVVAILDRGFDIAVNDLKPNIWQNRFEIPNNGIDDDKNGYIDDCKGVNMETKNDRHKIENHGTWCAGVIGASGNNNVGVTGVNWQVKMMILSGIVDAEKIIEGYNYVLKTRKRYNLSNGKEGAFVAVTSMSLGFSNKRPEDFPLLCEMYNALGQQGILNVVAADNVESDINISGDIPGLCASEHLLVVTRTNETDLLPRTAGFSTKYVDLAAPGESILTTYPNNQYDVIGGNSFAAPLVAGAAALLYSIPQDSLCNLSKKSPVAAMTLVKEALLKGVDVIPSLQAKTLTGGRLNLLKSYNQLRRLKGVTIGELAILKMFPNPVRNQLTLNLRVPENQKNRLSLVVFNTLGEVVIQRKIEEKDLLNEAFQLNTEGLSAGLYTISILSDTFNATQKFVVARP